MNHTDYAWAAGFFDGEGCCYIQHQVDRRHFPWYKCTTMSLGISQVNDEWGYSTLLDKFRDTFPQAKINIYIGKKSRNPNQQPSSQLTINKFQYIQDTMCKMWPWLGQVKKEQYARCVKEYLA